MVAPVRATRNQVMSYLDDLLRPGEWSDLGPNGLQVPGAEEVETVVTGVSGQAELFSRAAELGAQLVLVHHGILWDFHPRRIDARLARRLRLLLEHDISLAAYHLPLDAHPRVGNNALLAEALGCLEQGRRPFGDFKGRPVGVAASFPGDGVAIEELLLRVQAATGRPPLAFAAGPARVRTIGIVSGGGADALDEAVADGLDAFLTGEPREHVMADAREANIHFIAAGHYGTETFGVRRLGEELARRFGLRHEWVDIPNPV